PFSPPPVPSYRPFPSRPWSLLRLGSAPARSFPFVDELADPLAALLPDLLVEAVAAFVAHRLAALPADLLIEGRAVALLGGAPAPLPALPSRLADAHLAAGAPTLRHEEAPFSVGDAFSAPPSSRPRSDRAPCVRPSCRSLRRTRGRSGRASSRPLFFRRA